MSKTNESTNQKYKLLDKDPATGLHRIQALRDIPNSGVKNGAIGGLIASESNLSQSGDCWVYGDAQVYGNARVYGDAWVYGDAQVYGNARVYGDAWVYGDAQVYGNARVYGDAWVYGDAQVYGDAWVYGDAQVYGNARVYGDAWVLGDARVFGNARVFGDAWVFENAQVSGNAQVFGKSRLTINPLYAQGSMHLILVTDNRVLIGCCELTFARASDLTYMKKLGIKHNYTGEEQKEYKQLIKVLVAARKRQLKNKKED